MSRQYNFMPSRYVTEPPRVTPAAQSADKAQAPREDWAIKRRDRQSTPPDESRDEARARAHEAERLVKQLGELRILGRHSERPLSMADLNHFIEESQVPKEQGRAAYEAGLRDRARGMRCLCTYCGGMRGAIAEQARQSYRVRRYRELTGAGWTLEAAARQIEIEISRGEAH